MGLGYELVFFQGTDFIMNDYLIQNRYSLTYYYKNLNSSKIIQIRGKEAKIATRAMKLSQIIFTL